jgi:hypothetical protein
MASQRLTLPISGKGGHIRGLSSVSNRELVLHRQGDHLAQAGGGKDENGDPINGYAAPVIIMVDYEGGLSKRIGSLGAEIVVKNTIWTEYALANAGDYLLIGESTDADPVSAGADEVRQVIRYADTFYRGG